ncbi:MAG: hypothetical protein RML35_13065 [Chloroherpetonaceae bacterium]|nr:hypothetical protein [Chloroherpetonaceae bacterium]
MNRTAFSMWRGVLFWLALIGGAVGCTLKPEEPKKPESSIEKPAKKPVVIGFVQPVEDETLERGTQGLY